MAALRPEKDYPGPEPGAERLEGVRDAGGHEQEVARPERHPLGAAAEHAAAAGHDVDLILPVRLLGVHLLRGEQLDRQVAALEQHRERLRHPGQQLARLRQGNAQPVVAVNVHRAPP